MNNVDYETEINYIYTKLNKNTDKISLMGILGYTILSKLILPKNKDVVLFIKEIFNIQLPLYLTKSRTLMAAKIVKLIYITPNNELQLITNSLYDYFNKEKDNFKDFNNKDIKSNKKNANDKMKVWLNKL